MTEIEKRDRLVQQQERRNRKALAALLLLLIQGNVTRSTFNRRVRSQLVKLRQSTIDATSAYLGASSPGTAKTAGLASVAVHLSQRTQAIKSADPSMTPKQIVKALEPSIDRTVTTEVLRAHNNEYIRELKGIAKHVRWDATLDKRTCSACQALHGTRFRLEDAPIPPEHPRCRCMLIAD